MRFIKLTDVTIKKNQKRLQEWKPFYSSQEKYWSK